MADQSGSARLQDLFDLALQAYEKKTSIALAQHPLAVNLQNCQSVDDITTLLQSQAQAFNAFRESDRIMRAIKTIVSILAPLSGALSFANAVGSVRQKALRGCFTSLTPLPEFIPTYQGNTSWYWHTTKCMCRSPAHV
jgi:hypothetical protein